jgi:hypothetical protein
VVPRPKIVNPCRLMRYKDFLSPVDDSVDVLLFLSSAQLVNYQVAKSIYRISNLIDVLFKKLIRICSLSDLPVTRAPTFWTIFTG